MKHPTQPIETDEDGVRRFKRNAIVRYILDAGPLNMNDIALMPFSREDRQQFAQLIGYSFSGYMDLSYSEGYDNRKETRPQWMEDEDARTAQGEGEGK